MVPLLFSAQAKDFHPALKPIQPGPEPGAGDGNPTDPKPGGFAKGTLAGRKAGCLRRFIRETCRGELGHWFALGCAPVFFLWNPWWADRDTVSVQRIAGHHPSSRLASPEECCASLLQLVHRAFGMGRHQSLPGAVHQQVHFLQDGLSKEDFVPQNVGVIKGVATVNVEHQRAGQRH